MKRKKIMLIGCAIFASLLFTAGCSKSPKFTEQEGIDYIRNVLNTKRMDYFKARALHSVSDIEKIKIMSITGGVQESNYYDTPARIYTVTYKIGSDSLEREHVAVARDKSTGAMYMTIAYEGCHTTRW